MYKQFYQLVTNPFRLAPEPDFCFSHTGYRCAREYLDFALAEGEGFVMVTGRPGTGKTMLVETFLKEINTSNVVARRIAVSSYGATDLLRAIAYAYGIDAAGMGKGTMRHRIQQFFVQQEQAGRRVLLIIDEAQTLSHAALEELRILADLQTQSRLMLQLVLVGQESLQELMRIPDMEQFQQRVIANYQLLPLNLKDTRSYIEHRLLQAGWNGDPEFSGAAVLSIYQLSNGVPRHINKICNRLLLLGFGKGSHAFDEQDVLEISAEMQEEQLMPMEISQARFYDSENVTNLSEIRDGQVAVTGLAIRANKLDACAVAISDGSRLAAHKKKVFIARHHMPPASSDEQIASPEIKAGTPVTVMSESSHVAYAPPAATHNPDSGVVKDRHTDRFSWKKTLAVSAALLVLLTVFFAAVPLFPGRVAVKDMLSKLDHFPRWKQQLAAWQDMPAAPGVTADRQANAAAIKSHAATRPGSTTELAGSVAGNKQLVAGVIIMPRASTEVPQYVDDVPVQATLVTGVIERADTLQTDTIDKLLVQGRQALDDYRLVTPAGDNAYEYMSAVLQQDPLNETARAAIQEIVVIYTTLAAKAADNNQIERAERYLDRGLRIQPDDPDLLALKDTLDRRLEAAPVNRGTASPGVQLTSDNTTLREQPTLTKRRAADRRRDLNAATGEGS
jgi:type II secretory pathway predicted ATPase ExeA